MSGTICDVDEHNEHNEVDEVENDVADKIDDEVDDDDVAHRGTIEMCGSFISDKGVLS